jgi:TatD DNase family protein
MGVGLVDAHCHLDLYPAPERRVKCVEEAGIYTLAVTNAPSVFLESRRRLDGQRFVRTALGLHPELAARRRRDLPRFLELAGHTRYIGEVGLDYTTNDEVDRRAQARTFEAILAACARPDRLLSVHSRRAADAVLERIGTGYPATIVHHWFAGSLRAVERLVAAGHYVSVNPTMLEGLAGQRIVSALPRERVLTETDGPFAQVAGRPAVPSDVVLVVQHLARLWDLNEGNAAAQVLSNFRRALTPRDDATNIRPGPVVGRSTDRLALEGTAAQAGPEVGVRASAARRGI